jgi:hypothetical protein
MPPSACTGPSPFADPQRVPPAAASAAGGTCSDPLRPAGPPAVHLKWPFSDREEVTDRSHRPDSHPRLGWRYRGKPRTAVASAVFVPEAVHCASGLVERSLDATACGLALLDSVSGGRKTKRLKRLAGESREVGCPGITPEPLLDDVRRSTLAVVTAAVGSVALLAADARATFAGRTARSPSLRCGTATKRSTS